MYLVFGSLLALFDDYEAKSWIVATAWRESTITMPFGTVQRQYAAAYLDPYSSKISIQVE